MLASVRTRISDLICVAAQHTTADSVLDRYDQLLTRRVVPDSRESLSHEQTSFDF